MANRIMPDFHSAQKSFSAFTPISPRLSICAYPHSSLCSVFVIHGTNDLSLKSPPGVLKETLCLPVVALCRDRLMLYKHALRSAGLGEVLYGGSG